jgi:hypothetical protein
MSTLQIRMEPNPNLPSTVLVPAKVLNRNLEIAHSLSISTSGRATMVRGIDPGVYLVQAELPSGEIVTAQARVPDDETITLSPSLSPRETFAWQHFLGEIPTPATPPAIQGEITGSFAGQVATGRDMRYGLQRRPPTTPGREAWLRIWRRDPDSWELEPRSLMARAPETVPGTMGESIIYKIDYHDGSTPRAQALRYVQIGGPDIPWRLVSLPYSQYPIEVLVRSSRMPSELNGGVTVKVSTHNVEAELISHYLRTGAITEAGEVSRDLIGRANDYDEMLGDSPYDPHMAEDMLRYKLVDPYGATVGGYFLLRSAEYDRLHNWPNNLANWVRWLPDGPVIHAWQLLLTEETDSARQLARDRLLEAGDRGLPVLTEGLRLLIDGLELFAQNRPSDEPEGTVERTLDRLRRYASAVDWNQRLTTFYGTDPETPAIRRVTGVPTDLAGNSIEFVQLTD